MLSAFADEIAGIDAEESLAYVNVLQVGTGCAKPARARELISRWRRFARGARPPMTEAEWRSRLALAGIQLEVRGD